MAKTPTINFTAQAIQKILPPPKGRLYYKDSKEKGLCLYITSNGARTFFLRKLVNGRDQKIVIGSAFDLSVEQARKAARILKGKVAEGIDPVSEKRKEKANRLTFGEHFNDYLERYSKRHKKSWKYDEREVNRFLSHWFNRQLSDIQKGEIQKLILKIYDENGLYQANRILERIRAIYNKAIEWGWDGTNPTLGIKKYREKKRDRFIMPDEMPFLLQALEEESNETAKDYFTILLLVGQRRTNVLKMRWEEINWTHETWRIPDTKNGEPLTIPLTSKAIEILERRKKLTKSPWVFPSENSSSYYNDPSRAWERIRKKASLAYWAMNPNVAELIELSRSEINPEYAFDQFFKLVSNKAKKNNIELGNGLLDIRMHDVRRTFGSYQAITGASLQIIGKSLGHKSSEATQIYARLNLDPVRASMEKATSEILRLAKLRQEK